MKPKSDNVVKGSKYSELETKLQNAAIKYVEKHRNLLPTSNDNVTKIKLSTLQENNYIGKLIAVDDSSVSCDGYVDIAVINEEENDYRFTPYLTCGNYYTTKTIGDYIIDIETKDGTFERTTDAGLYKSGDEYIFRGEKVNNYLVLGEHKYKIIKIDKDKSLKLMSTVSTDNDYVWDDKALPEIHLDVSLSEWNRLLTLFDANPYTSQYVMGSISFVKDGETSVIDDVGIRIKGNTSRRRPEGFKGNMHETDHTDWHHAHFGVNLRKYVDDNAHTIQGVRKLYLKWFKDDPMYVREMFCYELFRRAGVWTAVRDEYCRLWIHVEGDSNEAYFGVYEMMEPIDKRYLKDRKNRFGSSDGYLWKCRNSAAGLNNPNGDIWYDDDTDDRHAYTLETLTEDFENARLQLQNFMNQLNGLNDNKFYAWIQQVTDVDLLLKTYAVNVAVGMWDDYWNNANNYYLYFNSRDLHDYKVFFIPYDYDNTLGTSLHCGNQSDAGRQDPLDWGMSNNRFISRILAFSDFRAKYISYLKFLVTSGNAMMDRPTAQARIRAWHNKIAAYIDNDTGEDTVIKDKPASWGNHSEYHLLKNDGDNFFTVKAASIAPLQ